MAIVITDNEPTIYLTAEEHARLQAEYQNAFMFYAGTPPSFESWVRNRGTAQTLINEASADFLAGNGAGANG